MNRFELSLDLDKRIGKMQLVTLRQGDRRGTEIRATIYDHGQQVSGNYTCRVTIRHPNNSNTYYRETATYSNGVATVTINEDYAATVVGITEGYFELLQGSTVIASTESFGVRILRSATDGAVAGEVYDSAIEDALAELDEATGRINQMVVDATEEYLNAHPELTTTVEDNSLTDAKLIQQGGILSRVDRLMYRLDNLLTNTPAEAESVTVSDAAKTPVAGLALYGKSTQNGTPTPSAPVPIQSVGPQNLLSGTQVNSGSRYVSNGITFDLGADGSLHIHGTATANSVWDGNWRRGFVTNAIEEAGAYTLSLNNDGSLNGVTCSVTYRPQTAGSQSSTTSATGVSVLSFSLSESALVDGNLLSVGFYVNSGITVDVTVRPMLVAGTSAYAYVPYNHVGLWARGRNLLRNIASAGTNHGVTFTMNADGSVTAIGTTPAGEQASVTLNAFVALKAGNTYTLSGCPANGGNSKWRLYFSGSSSYYDNGAGTTFTPESDMVGSVIISIYAGQTVNFTYYPQLELGSTATAYQPYAESVTDIPLDGHTLRSLPDGTRDELTVDERGHVTLTQRVGSVTLDGSVAPSGATAAAAYFNISALNIQSPVRTERGSKGYCDRYEVNSNFYSSSPIDMRVVINASAFSSTPRITFYDSTHASSFATWLQSNPVTLLYKLATPVTYDLGTIDPTALVGPDMTATGIPTAPFALTYERDLNVTLARLEAAIADAATA